MLDGDPPVGLHKELSTATTECGYGVEAFEMLPAENRREAKAKIDLMRESDAVEQITVCLTVRGYRVA